MFKLSAETEYAYIALIRLAANFKSKTSTKLAEIVAPRNLSEKFMLQVLTDLRRGGLVHSRRGKNGGYSLARAPQDITMADLFAVTAGPGAEEAVTLENAGDESHLASLWRGILEEIQARSRSTTLSDALEQEQKESAPMYHI